MTSLKTQAIQTALTGDWNNAIRCNEELLAENPSDIDTLNRLAYAYMSSGNSKRSKEICEQVLSLDKQNPIAMRNLKRISEIKTNDGSTNHSTIQINNLFIEEPGKTRVIELINPADKKVLSVLRSGEELELTIKRMKIFVHGPQKQFIGMLPDDIGNRLIKFINGGNAYDAYLRTSQGGKAVIFVREIKKAKKFKDQASFVSIDKTKLELNNSTKHKKS